MQRPAASAASVYHVVTRPLTYDRCTLRFYLPVVQDTREVLLCLLPAPPSPPSKRCGTSNHAIWCPGVSKSSDDGCRAYFLIFLATDTVDMPSKRSCMMRVVAHPLDVLTMLDGEK